MCSKYVLFKLLASIPMPGDECLAVGWGITDAETTPVEVADTLQEVEVPILNNCTKRYSNASMYICGGFAEGGKDSCQGMYRHYFLKMSCSLQFSRKTYLIA